MDGRGEMSIDPSDLVSKKDEIMDGVRTQLAMATTQQLVSKVNEKCFSKCVTKPGSRLDGSEQTCLAKCMDRYMDAWNIVSNAYYARMTKDNSGTLQ